MIYAHRPDAFQFTPLREGRQAAEAEKLGEAYFVNSRPCERGDKPLKLKSLAKRIVSIHAPARGATFQ